MAVAMAVLSESKAALGRVQQQRVSHQEACAQALCLAVSEDPLL